MIEWFKKLEELSLVDKELKESVVLSILPPELHSEWDNFMRGKTCPLLDNGDHGIYNWDLSQFLQRLVFSYD